MCIQMNKTLDEKKGFAFETREFYLKNTDEMIKKFVKKTFVFSMSFLRVIF